MYWFWIHTLFSVIFIFLLCLTFVDGVGVYKKKSMVAFQILPAVLKTHMRRGYVFFVFAFLSLSSGYMARQWSGWYALIHQTVPYFFFPLLIVFFYSAYKLKGATGTRPFFHVVLCFGVLCFSILQFVTGMIMLFLRVGI